MKKVLKWVVVLLLVAFVVIQFKPVEKTNPPVDPAKTIYASMNVPANVHDILQRSCKDCHSNETHWPWYSHVAPVSWLVADDVRVGRKEMNLSEWATFPEKRKQHKLDNICKQVTKGSMPLPKYTLIHRGAVLTQSDRDTLCQWVKTVNTPVTSTAEATPSAAPGK